MSKQTNDLDFKIDFSSNASIGTVGDIDSFLSDDSQTEVKEEASVDNGDGIENFLGEETSKKETNEALTTNTDSEEPKVEINLESKEEEQVAKDDEDKSKSVESKLNFKEVLVNLIKDNKWDSIDAFEGEDGEEISFDDMEIDEELFYGIVQQKIDESKEKEKANKVSVEHISEFTQKLIEIEKNGGNVQQALESFQRYKNPLEGLDLTKKSDQQAVLYMKHEAKGLEQDDIIRLIKSYDDEQLLEQAKIAEEQLTKAFNDQMEAINQQAIDAKVKRKEALKEYRGTLSSELKKFELNDKYSKKLLDVATKEDSQGNFQLDVLYNDIRKDPTKSAELVLFLTDRDEFIKQVTREQSRDKDLKVMKTFKLLKKSKGSNVKIEDKELDRGSNYVDMEDLY